MIMIAILVLMVGVIALGASAWQRRMTGKREPNGAIAVIGAVAMIAVVGTVLAWGWK